MQNQRNLTRFIIILSGVIVVLSLILLGWSYFYRPPANTTPVSTLAATAILSTAVVELPTPTLEATVAPSEPTHTPAPTDTPAATNTATPAPSPTPRTAVISYTVVAGDSLLALAIEFDVSVEKIAELNELENLDDLQIDQVLRIPIPSNSTPTPVVTETITVTAVPTITVTATLVPGTAVLPIIDPPTAPPNWPPSLTAGDLSANYPLSRTTPAGNFTLYFQPGTYAAANIDTLATAVDAIWADLENQLDGSLRTPIDMYLAGALFAVNPALQGFTQSWEYRTFILTDGVLDQGEAYYILGHELSHLAGSHIIGPAASTMLHEGLGVHLPQKYLVEQAGYLPHTEMCAAAFQTDGFVPATPLAGMTYAPTGFGGHIRTFFHYNLSGCFVTYLLETYGLDSFKALYTSGDYEAVYGRSLADLDVEWQIWLGKQPVSVDAQSFVDMVNTITDAYETYVTASDGGIHANYPAYLHLNQARLAANQGNLTKAEADLETYWSLMETEE